MEKQVSTPADVWLSYGIVILGILVAVVVAAIKDVRLANAVEMSRLN